MSSYTEPTLVCPAHSPLPADGFDGRDHFWFALSAHLCSTQLLILLLRRYFRGPLQACNKARDYLLQKIGELRRPKTNVQIIQKNSLLK